MTGGMAGWPAMSCRVESDDQPGEPLLQSVMRNGRRVAPSPTLAESRARAARDLERLPECVAPAGTGRAVSGPGGRSAGAACERGRQPPGAA